MITRRELMSGALASTLLPASAIGIAGTADGVESLRLRAQRKGMSFGCGTTRQEIESDALYRAAVLADCSQIVPTSEMKWGVIEHHQGHEDYSAADALVDFATTNSLKIRGHTAVWYVNVPPWVEQALAGPDAAQVFERHVRGVLGHFGSRVASWDVVNEAIWIKDGLPGGYRNSIFYRTFGPSYIQRAYEIAREAAPGTPLFYNEFGLEYADQFHSAKRAATLQLLTQLKKQGLVDGLGIQSHLHLGWGSDFTLFRHFLADVRDLGLKVLLTEFDVEDSKGPTDPAARDVAVANHAREYLGAAFAEQAVKGLIAWDLSDRNTWLNGPPFRRADGQPNRGQPLDQALQRKPLWDAIGECFDAAASRSP